MKLVIFDADGTLTSLRGSSTGLFIPILLSGVVEKCATLHSTSVKLAIASNQNSKRSRDLIVFQLRWTQKAIKAHAIRWATTEKRRKPFPAMLYELMAQFDASPTETLFVGDRETDKQAADAAGCNFEFANRFFGE